MDTESKTTDDDITALADKITEGAKEYTEEQIADGSGFEIAIPEWYDGPSLASVKDSKTKAERIVSWTFALAATPVAVRKQSYKVNKTSHKILLELSVWLAATYKEAGAEVSRESIVEEIYPSVVETFIRIK
jgi:hypothetical protein